MIKFIILFILLGIIFMIFPILIYTYDLDVKIISYFIKNNEYNIINNRVPLRIFFTISILYYIISIILIFY